MEYEDNTPPEIMQKAIDVCNNLLPSTSREKYEIDRNFMDGKIKAKLLRRLKSSTLWSQYSMLRSTLMIKNCVDISKYVKQHAFLKRKSEKYVLKQSKTLTSGEIQQFLKDAPDEKYFLIKAALAIGLTGACRYYELRKLKIDDMEDLNSALSIKLPDTKTKVPRNFSHRRILQNLQKIYKASSMHK